MTDEPDQMPNLAAVMRNREELIHQLRRWLLSPNKAGPDDIITLQARYVAALGEVETFLRAAGEDDLALKFVGLAGAIGELRKGTVADVVRPTPAGGASPDGIMVWSLREDVVIGLECILKSGKKKTLDKAAQYIADKYPVFNQLKRNSTHSLDTSILSWRRYINNGEVPEAETVLARQHSFFERHGGDDCSPAEMFALGEQLLAEVADRTTKAVF
jgi:hypothetical protein